MLRLLVSIGFQVLFHSPPGVLFTFPSRYYTLSVTWSYLALWDGPHIFRQDSSCPDVLRILAGSTQVFAYGAFTLSRLPFQVSSADSSFLMQVLYPNGISTVRLGSSDFARHYFRNRFFFLFLRVIRCFSSPGSLDITIDSLYRTATLLAVSSLIRISAATIAHLQLAAAFRSLSRPSSAPCTKASSLRSS